MRVFLFLFLFNWGFALQIAPDSVLLQRHINHLTVKT